LLQGVWQVDVLAPGVAQGEGAHVAVKVLRDEFFGGHVVFQEFTEVKEVIAHYVRLEVKAITFVICKSVS
jgi:hypothetical protein